MADLGALYNEYRELKAVWLDEDRRHALDEAGVDRVWERMNEVRTTIETTPPATGADCSVKVRVLFNLGQELGDDPDDLIALRQVAKFLETRG